MPLEADVVSAGKIGATKAFLENNKGVDIASVDEKGYSHPRKGPREGIESDRMCRNEHFSEAVYCAGVRRALDVERKCGSDMLRRRKNCRTAEVLRE